MEEPEISDEELERRMRRYSRTARWQGETCQLEALSPDSIAHILRSNITDLFETRQVQVDLAEQAIERQQIAYALPAPGEAP